MKLIRILGFSSRVLNLSGLMGKERLDAPSRWILIVVGLAFAAQYIRSQCSMANMPGFELVQCLLNNWVLLFGDQTLGSRIQGSAL